MPHSDPYDSIGAEEVGGMLRRSMGLIIGPGLTHGPGCLAELARSAAGHFNVQPSGRFFQVADAAIATGVTPSDLRVWARDAIAALPTASVLALARARWCAVLSSCYDSRFEVEHQAWCEKAPTRRSVTTVDDLRQSVPPRTVPVYKLLGSAHRDDYVVCSNDYRIRQQSWQGVLREFSAYVRGNPVFCTGLAECSWVLLDLIASMLYDPKLVPGPLLLLDEDPLLGNQQLAELSTRGVRITRVAAGVGEVVRAATKARQSGYTRPITFDDARKTAFERLAGFDDLATLVNMQLTSSISSGEVHRLRDLLFSPTAPQWDPYFHKLDFARTSTLEVVDAITKSMQDKQQKVSAVLLTGSAACGKTTVLKRAAFELAQGGTLVLWMRPYFYQDGQTVLKRLIETIKDTNPHSGRPFVIFVDDPIALGSVRLEDVCAAVRSANLLACVVVAMRSTDALTMDISVATDKAPVELDLPERFDESEWRRLADYLVDLGIANARNEAQAMVSAAPEASARDVLSMLFWLLPETRQRITASIRNEHLRLGDRNAFARLVVGELSHSTQWLRDAYELVAVAADYGAPVPIEVLVAALDTDYNSWLALAQPEGLLWGLLYCEESESSESVLYRPRNRVVTDIIVEAVNSGTLGHTGELAKLRRMLESCSGGAPAYREFCTRVLVPSDRARLQPLEYAEGLDLYELAIRALPHEDRTLVHHMGLWQKNKGRAYIQARQTLEKAVQTRIYPYASRGEPEEHIYTSLAANELDSIRNKVVSAVEGKETALAYLERARSATFLNPNAVHVQAKLIVELAELSGSPAEPDSMRLIGQALGEIDRMLLMLRSPFRSDAERRNQVDMLTTARSEVLERCVSLEDIRRDADKVWDESQRQDGFALCARKLLGIALDSNRGSHFKEAFEYCEAAASRIRDAGAVVSISLLEVQLQLYLQWQVKRRLHSESTEPLDWDRVDRLAVELLRSPYYADDPFYLYLSALAKAHLGEWTLANGLFDQLRRRKLPGPLLHEPRDFLLAEKGGMARIQGMVVQGAGKRFLKVESLNTDLMLDRNETWGRVGETEHVYVRFSFAGPLAVKEDVPSH